MGLLGQVAYSQGGLSRVWAIDDGEKILQNKINHTAANGTNNTVWNGSSISLFGGKNEVVAFQVILQGNATGASGVNVILDSLTRSGTPGYTIKNTGGSTDPYNYVGKRIEMFVEHYQSVTSRSTASFIWWSAARPLPDSDFLGMLPEQLVPFEAAAGPKSNGQGGAPFRVPANGNQAVWVDIFVPHEAPAGIYTGTLRVTECDMALKPEIPDHFFIVLPVISGSDQSEHERITLFQDLRRRFNDQLQIPLPSDRSDIHKRTAPGGGLRDREGMHQKTFVHTNRRDHSPSRPFRTVDPSRHQD